MTATDKLLRDISNRLDGAIVRVDELPTTFTVAQVAEMTGKTEQSVRRLCRLGKLACIGGDDRPYEVLREAALQSKRSANSSADAS